MQKQLVLLGLLALTLIVKNLTLVWFILVIIIIKPFLSSHIVFYQLPTGEMSNSNSIDIRVFSHVQLVESIIKFCCLIQMGSVHLCLMCNRKSRLCFVLLYSIISTM